MFPNVLTPHQSSSSVEAELVRQKIRGNCLSGSWFAMRPVLQQLQSALEAGPELLADLLACAGARSRHDADRLQRLLSQRSWHASAVPVAGVRQALTLQCAGESWTLRLLTRPQLHIETIARNARASGG